MSTTTLNATATYYHMAADGAKMPWLEGMPKKGTSNGRKAIGLIMFDRNQMRAALKSEVDPSKNKALVSANLILYRDTSYGTDPVDLSLTYTLNSSTGGSMTHEQCMEFGYRNAHTQVTASGATSVIPLPGFMLQRLLWYLYGFVIYQEDGEGTDKFAQFTGAKLQLKTYDSNEAKVYDNPVWTRPIGQGDDISSKTRSHCKDLREIEYYINLRRAINNLTAIDKIDNFQTNDMIQYLYWRTLITFYQQAINDIYTAEGKTAISWIAMGNASSPDSSSNILLPNAAAVNQLRNALESKPSGTKEALTVTDYARTEFSTYDSYPPANRSTVKTWVKAGPRSGMNWQWSTHNGQKAKEYMRHFGFWLLKGLISGKTINKGAKLRLNKINGNEGNHEIKLYPVKISSVPTTASLDDVFLDTGEVMGSAYAVKGQTVEIPLTADAINKLLNNGSYYGVGVEDEQQWSYFDASATLIINYQD